MDEDLKLLIERARSKAFTPHPAFFYLGPWEVRWVPYARKPSEDWINLFTLRLWARESRN